MGFDAITILVGGWKKRAGIELACPKNGIEFEISISNGFLSLSINRVALLIY
jgi:hypothetical protein